MNTSRITAACGALGRPALAGLLLVLVLFSSVASAAPCLHHWLHSESQAPAHYCLVTVLEHGQNETASSPVHVFAPILSIAYRSAYTESFFISHDLALHPERGPPAQS